MVTDCATIVERLCTLPVTYPGTWRFTNIAKAAQVNGRENCLSFDAVRSYLDEHPDLLDLWQQWSWDQRWAGWWLDGDAVELSTGTPIPGPRLRLENRSAACAYFLLRHIERYTHRRSRRPWPGLSLSGWWAEIWR